MDGYTKDPSDVLDYGFNWSDWLGTDTIAESTWSISPTETGGVAADPDQAASATSTETLIWLQGGVVGHIYTITNRIVTLGGREKELSLQLRIIDK
jgi:hypothetical protein